MDEQCLLGGCEMYSLFTLACLLLAPCPQEKQEAPPPAASKGMAHELISGAKPVKGERTTPAGTPVTRKDFSSKGGAVSTARGTHATPKTGDTDKHVSDADTHNHATHIHINDAYERISSMFTENALYQQELAARTKVISVEDVTTPEAALAELKAGNDRFIKGGRVRTLMTAQDKELRATLAKKQAPFGVIITCSDSRAMDNLIFDQELGRLFSIRAAGNSPDTLGIASIEYSVEHLGSKIVVIMGHTKCGAVGAVADAKGEPLHDHLYIFQHLMAGLLESTPKGKDETDADYKDRLEQVNAVRQAQALYNRSNLIREHVDHKKIWLLPASYDLATGEVTFFKPIEGGQQKAAHH
jgi:carbonic anhydrase